MSLYKIEQDLLALFNDVKESEGEIMPEQEQELSILEGQLSSKVSTYDWVIKKLDSENNLIDSEIERLCRMKESNSKIKEKLESKLLEALLLFGQEQSNGVKKLKCGFISLSTRKSSHIVVDESYDNNYDVFTVKYSGLSGENAFEIVNIINNLNIEADVKKSVDKVRAKKDLKEKTIEGISLEETIHLKIS